MQGISTVPDRMVPSSQDRGKNIPLHSDQLLQFFQDRMEAYCSGFIMFGNFRDSPAIKSIWFSVPPASMQCCGKQDVASNIREPSFKKTSIVLSVKCPSDCQREYCFATSRVSRSPHRSITSGENPCRFALCARDRQVKPTTSNASEV